jgi:hypothetical protein
MKNYYNNWFYNLVLPCLIFAGFIGCAIGFAATNNGGFLFLMIGVGVSFKFVHNRLESLSQQQREDYDLVGYAGSLSNKNEADILKIKAEMTK